MAVSSDGLLDRFCLSLRGASLNGRGLVSKFSQIARQIWVFSYQPFVSVNYGDQVDNRRFRFSLKQPTCDLIKLCASSFGPFSTSHAGTV